MFKFTANEHVALLRWSQRCRLPYTTAIYLVSNYIDCMLTNLLNHMTLTKSILRVELRTNDLVLNPFGFITTRKQTTVSYYPTTPTNILTNYYYIIMFPKRFLSVLLLALCFIAAASAAPVPVSSAIEQSSPEFVVRANVGEAINTKIDKVSRKFKLSRTAVIAIAIGCSIAALLLFGWFACCCFNCCIFF